MDLSANASDAVCFLSTLYCVNREIANTSRVLLKPCKNHSRKRNGELAHHIGDFDHPVNLCVFEIRKDADKAKEYEQTDRKRIQNDRQDHAVSDRQSNQGSIDHQITDRTDQHGSGVEFSGLIPEKTNDSRRAQQHNKQRQRLHPDNV